MRHVLTHENLRPLADTIAHQVQETNGDVSIQLSALQAQLAQVERQIDNLLGAIENIGLSPSLKENSKTEITQLEKMIMKSGAIPAITDEMIEPWLDHIRLTLSSGNADVAQKALRQFVSKVVIKDRMGMIYYMFPVAQEEGCISLGKGNVDLRGFEPLTSTVRL